MGIAKKPSIRIWRLVVGALFLVLLNCSWGPEAKWLCLPLLNCHSCALAWFACPIGVLQHYSGYHVVPILALGLILLPAVLIGRLLCGWICPFGFLQDLLHRIPSPKFSLPQWTSYIKFLVLGILVLAFPFFLGPDTYFSFCRICPASALQVAIPSIIQEGPPENIWPTMVRMHVLAIVLVGAVVSSRSFCKVLCPIGAILAPLNYLAFWAIKVPTQNCLSCKKCDRVCPVEGEPSERIAANISPNRELNCIVCHECQQTCPMQGKPGPEESAPSSTPESPEREQSSVRTQ